MRTPLKAVALGLINKKPPKPIQVVFLHFNYFLSLSVKMMTISVANSNTIDRIS